jgi:hypothetical protein
LSQRIAGRSTTLRNPEKQPAILKIYNLAGQEAFQRLFQSEFLAIETGLSRGVYIVNVVSDTSLVKTKIFIQ